jgi:hypothetical protein
LQFDAGDILKIEPGDVASRAGAGSAGGWRVGLDFSHANSSFSEVAGTAFLLTMIMGLLGSRISGSRWVTRS